MSAETIKALLIEDQLGDARLTSEMVAAVTGTPTQLSFADRLSTGMRRLAKGGIDVVLLDLGLPDSQGLATFATVYAQVSEIPIVVLTGIDDEKHGVEAVQQGAQDYLVKGQVDGDTLLRTIRYAIERKRSQQRIHYLAYYDSLTSLPNRRLFHDRLSQSLALARRYNRVLAVLFFDLDHFKTVNDTLGHPVGDLLLQTVAERLSCLRASDTIARLGGDEFAILLPEITLAEDVSAVAEKILVALKPPFAIGGNELFTSTSMGISIYPNDGEDPETLMKNVDIAMYRAKQEGGNNYQLYSPALGAKVAERMALANRLRQALEREEFVLHYQPQVDLSSGHIVGVEALLRWRHPDLGLVAAAQFIHVAEDSGLIVPIGEWVLRSACAQMQTWHAAGLTQLSGAVNLSNGQFRQNNLLETVTRTLIDTGLDPNYLVLELTERTIMENADAAIGVLRELHARGIQISLDDFGTGHCSLSCLKSFPVDNLKIDQSFICGIPSNPDDAVITRTVIAMAHGLSLNVIAEGVETAEQLAFLRKHRCDQFQGYYFSQPVSAEAFTQLLREPVSLPG
jgi:diguanylate cyclase (GGDEF)-like protein